MTAPIPLVRVPVPPGTLTPAIMQTLNDNHIATSPEGTDIWLPAGSQATRMPPGLVAKLLELKLLTNGGTVQPSNFERPMYSLVSTEPMGTYHLEAMLAGGKSKREVLYLIDDAEIRALRTSPDPKQWDTIKANAEARRAQLADWPYVTPPEFLPVPHPVAAPIYAPAVSVPVGSVLPTAPLSDFQRDQMGRNIRDSLATLRSFPMGSVQWQGMMLELLEKLVLYTLAPKA